VQGSWRRPAAWEVLLSGGVVVPSLPIVEDITESVLFPSTHQFPNQTALISPRGCNKVITLPNGEMGKPQRPLEPTPMQLALARGHRWLAMLESGEVKTLTEIAKREGVDNSYVSRMVNLSMLSPYVIQAILDDTLPDNVTLLELAVDPPLVWSE
jgi:hypothetical protein